MGMKAIVVMEGIGCVSMDWDGCEGPWVCEGVLELIWKVQGGYGTSVIGIDGLGVGEEGLGLVWRAQGGCKEPWKSVRSQRWGEEN